MKKPRKPKPRHKPRWPNSSTDWTSASHTPKEIRELCEANMAVIKERIISDVNHYNGDELIDCLESDLGRYRKELSEKNAKDSEIAMMETIYKSIL